MSVPSKSIDKNKRYAGVKTNDFVNKARTNEASRAPARTQGWANLGKINSRRIPPPANVPSLKSETNASTSSFDPTMPTSTSHGWTASGNQTATNLANNQARPLTPSKQPTQQQLDSLPASASTPPPYSQQPSSLLSSDLDKHRGQASWSTVTAGQTNDHPPNLLGLNDFPRLVTQDNKSTKSPSDSLISSISSTTAQGPSFRPANLASWKEGGGRLQPMSSDLVKDSNENNNNSNLSSLSMQSQILPTNTNSNLLQSQMSNANNSSYMRMYPQQQQQQQHHQQQQQQQQMWSYNTGNSYSSYGTNQAPASIPIHQLHHQQRSSSYGNNNQSSQHQRLNTSTDYKTPTILRNKDIDDLSKITANVTWASASQEVNYEEKIRFSDDEDNDINDTNTTKSRRYGNNNSQQQFRQTYPHVLQNNNRSSHSNYSQQQQQQQQSSTHSRLLHEDDHVKQMQDDKNSELISTLTVAKQRRDEQERNLRDTVSQRPTTSTTVSKSFDEQKQVPGYQTRPLLSSTGQENLPATQTESTSLWGQSNSGTTTSRTRHDTTDSQQFAMKSWSDQMDSFNYASLHEKSGVDVDDHNDDTTVGGTSGLSVPHKYSRSHSESSSQSQVDNGSTVNRSKHFPLSNRRQQKSDTTSSKTTTNTSRLKSKRTDVINYFDNNEQQIKSNDHWGEWEDSSYSNNNRYQQQNANDRRRQQQHQSTDDLSQKSNRYNEQTHDYNRTKQSIKSRSNVAPRPTDLPTSTTATATATATATTTTTTIASKSENKAQSNKNQRPWRPLSPARPLDPNDPTPQESVSYKSESKLNDLTDRRQSAPIERKQRYASTPTTLNTSSIPSLMSVRSDVLPTSLAQTNPSSSLTSKHYKTSNQSQRQDYNSSSHYSQRNDFYNEANDSTWGNDDDYYEDETGYYDPNAQTHQRHHNSMGYHSHTHHRGYTTLGSYGRYRRGGTLRHQQQYSTYNTNNTSGTSSSQFNTNTGSTKKKTPITRTTPNKNKEAISESSEQQPSTIVESSNVISDSVVKKPSAWSTDTQPSKVEEIPIIKSVETPTVPSSITIEKPIESTITTTEPMKNDNESNLLVQSESELPNKKTTTTIASSQKKSSRDQQNYQQDQRYQNQQVSRHRTNYSRSMQDYESMQMSAQNYYGTNHRTTGGSRNARMHDLSSGYYYEPSQQRYNNRYNYSNEHYPQSRSTIKTTKRGGSSSTIDRQQKKSKTITTSNNTSSSARQPSVSDNELKEGEEWETASESSTNMRNTHHDNNQQQTHKPTTTTTTTTTNDIKAIDHERTPPKKSFSSQRPLSARHNESGIHRRTYNIYDRSNKASRGLVSHRTGRLSSNFKQSSPQKTDGENSTTKQMGTSRKDQHRHSLDGYDLNNVAGVVKIETLPAGALEEESTAFDDGGEEFCVVMSKRGRKEQKAAQLSKQNAIESTTEQITKSTSVDNDEQQSNEKSSNDDNQTNSTRARNGKSLPPRFNSKSTTRQHNTKNEHQNNSIYYYDQNYYYYDQSQYYDHDNSYYNYGNYNQSHRQTSTRRKQRSQQNQDSNTIDEQLNERKIESNVPDKTHTIPSNVMSNIQMWDPHTDSTISKSSKLIEKPTHDRKFGNEIAPPSSSSNDASLPLHPRTASALPAHSTASKTNETIARTIKPPSTDNKTDRDNKTKSSSYEKNDTISSLGSNQLFEKSTFLDYDDKQSIGTVGDDLNQKINSIKTIWDISEHPRQLEQTINTMVAMKQQQQENNIQSNSSAKTDSYVPESIPTSAANKSGPNTNVSSSVNDDTHSKNPPTVPGLQSTGSSSTMNQSATYSSTSGSNKNEQKNICTVKPTQQVAPNIQDQVDVGGYPPFPPPTLQAPMSQVSLQQQQQHLLPQSQVNPLHQQPSYPFYEGLLPPHPQQQPPPPQQQQAFNRIYSSTSNTTSTDPINSDFSGIQSSQIYPPQNFSFRNTNMYMQPPPPNVPNTNSIYHHTSQGSISAPPQNNALPPPPPMPSYPSPFLVDHGAHMLGQAQPPQGYMNNQIMSGRPQGGPFYRTPPPQQIQTPPGPPYGSQDPLGHGGYYPTFFPPPNSNAPGHPTTHNLYGQNEGFHPGHPQLFTRGGSIDRNDHSLMSQALSRQTNYPSNSSNQQQQGPPPSLLSQNLKPPFHTNQQQSSSANQPSFYPPPPPPNQFNRAPVPIGAMNSANNRPQNQQVPSLMSGFSKNLSNTGNNMNNTQPLFQQRQPLLPPQSNNNRSLYQHHPPYPNYSKSTGSNDDNVKQKHT